MGGKKKYVPIPFPTRGFSGYSLNHEKPLDWAQDAENVSGEFPGTGKRQGGQRAGLKRHTTATVPGSGIQAGISVAHDQPAFDFTNGLTTDVWGNTSEALDGATDVRLDEHGNTYWLTEGGVITKRNSDGVVVYSSVLPITPSLEPCPRILLIDGGVMAAASSVSGLSGAVLWKLEEREDRTGLDIAAVLELETRQVVSLELDATAVMVAVNGGGRVAEVLTVIGIAGVDMAIQTRHVVPYPVGDIAVGPRGIYSVSRPDVLRGEQQAGEGFVSPVSEWDPTDGTDLNNGIDRVHAWYDSEHSGTGVDGGRMNAWADYRISGELANIPNDDTNRTLGLTDFTLPDRPLGPIGPTWRKFSAGSAPGVQFNPTESRFRGLHDIDRDGGNAFQTSNLNANIFPVRGHKVDVGGSLPAANGIWPLNDDDYKFATCIIARWEPGALPGVIWLGGAYREAGVNVNVDGRGLPPADGYLAITINDDGASPALPSDGKVCLRGGALAATIVGTATSHNPSSPLRMAIITIVRNGAGLDVFRVNGVQVGAAMTIDDSGFASNTEFWGNRVYSEDDMAVHNGTAIAPYMVGVDSLQGVVLSAMTIMADSSGGSIHNDLTPTALPTFDDDVEAMEGYMAHRYGCAADALPGTHTYQGSPPSGSGSLPGVSDTNEALRSKFGILMKLDSSGDGAVWAISGGGIGDAVVTDDDGGVFCMGLQAMWDVPSYPVTSLGPFMRTSLKVIDRGVTVDQPEHSSGLIRFDGNPVDGDYFTVSDGVNSETFEWGVAPNVVPGSTLLTIQTTVWANVDEAVKKVSSSTTISMDANHEGTFDANVVDLALVSRVLPGAAATPIVISVGAPFSAVEGMTGPSAYATGVWAITQDRSWIPQNRTPRPAIDAAGDFYQPLSILTAGNMVFHRSGETGALVRLHRLGGGSSDYQANAVAVDSNDEDLLPATGPEHIWVAAGNTDSAGAVLDTRATQYKTEWIASTPNGDNTRTTTTIVVSGGKVYDMSAGGAATALETSPSFTPTAKSVQAIEMFGEVFLCDNGTYRVVNLRKGSVEVWEPDTAGEMPDGARLLTKYRGRAVMARTKTDPHGLYASAHGDPYDWDVARSLTDITGAFEGVSTKRNPDMVQALCPFYDDFLIIGGASSITQLKGDLSAAGSIDLFTDATGIAYGQSYALSPDGLLYFFGSRGGVWVMQPGTDGRSNPPVEISEHTVGREMANVDLSLFEPHLTWDLDRNGLHVMLIYIGPGSSPTSPRHWFYDASKRAWWPVTFGSSLALPTAMWTQQGDTKADRAVMLGFADGELRKWDDSAADDDGVAIDSYVVMGPIGDPLREYGIHELQMGVSKLGGRVRYQVFASDDPEELGSSIHSGSAPTGFSGSIRASGLGSSLWIKVGSATLEESWGLNELGLSVADNGARRRR